MASFRVPDPGYRFCSFKKRKRKHHQGEDSVFDADDVSCFARSAGVNCNWVPNGAVYLFLLLASWLSIPCSRV